MPNTKPDEMPWDDLKVAFSIKDEEAYGAWLNETDQGNDFLPASWELDEIDCSGARCVTVFRVGGMITREDGETVLALLAPFNL